MNSFIRYWKRTGQALECRELDGQTYKSRNTWMNYEGDYQSEKHEIWIETAGSLYG